MHVNRKFADAVCAEVDSDDPIVLVQDYHFALAPKMIRERLPRATIITFWHIPWPNAERIGICPWREELISGMLGSSVVGFHTQQHCNNFIDSVERFMESRIDREATAVFQGNRKTLVRPYPISIEWPVHWLKDVPPVAECAHRRAARARAARRRAARRGRRSARLHQRDRGAARWPSTSSCSGIPSCADGSRSCSWRRRAAPRSRAIASSTSASRRWLPRSTRKWANGSYRPIVLLRAHHEPTTVFRYYRAAELCYVSSLHDGMNLVAKEFVAARDDEQGVLVLSQFTGAARELTEALIVNPYDLRQAAASAGGRAAHAAPPSSACACSRCEGWSRSSTSTAGRGACSSMPPSCAAKSGCPGAFLPWRMRKHEVLAVPAKRRPSRANRLVARAAGLRFRRDFGSHRRRPQRQRR